MIQLETLIELKIVNFELFEFILLLELDKQFPVEQSEATVSQSTVPFPPVRCIIPSQAIAACLYIVGSSGRHHKEGVKYELNTGPG